MQASFPLIKRRTLFFFFFFLPSTRVISELNVSIEVASIRRDVVKFS